MFNVLSAAGKSWGFYWVNDGGPAAGSPPGVPFTQWLCPQMDQAPNGGVYPVNDGSADSFMNRLAAGTLPNFCYLEPKWGGGIVGNTFTTIQGTDYHPPSSVAPAEWYLNELYNAIIASPQWPNMLFIVTFDEHGGTYDHVPPPATVAPDGVRGKSGFTFQRLGVRVPTLLISPYVPAGVVFRSPVPGIDFDHTSLIATLLKWADGTRACGNGEPRCPGSDVRRCTLHNCTDRHAEIHGASVLRQPDREYWSTGG